MQASGRGAFSILREKFPREQDAYLLRMSVVTGAWWFLQFGHCDSSRCLRRMEMFWHRCGSYGDLRLPAWRLPRYHDAEAQRNGPQPTSAVDMHPAPAGISLEELRKHRGH